MTALGRLRVRIERERTLLGMIGDTSNGSAPDEADRDLDVQRLFDEHPDGRILDRVNDFGDDTLPWLTWPEHLTPHLVTDSE